MEYYENELERLCADVADLELWREILAKELESTDINHRDCYWAAGRQEIEASMARVTGMIKAHKK